MNISQTIKLSLLTLVVASITGSSFMLNAEETKEPTQKTSITLTMPSTKTALRYGLKVIEEIFPYIGMIAYFSYISPRIEGFIETTGTVRFPSTKQWEFDNNGKATNLYTSPALSVEKFNIKGVQSAANEIMKCFLVVWCADKIKKHAELIKNIVKTGEDLLLTV
jgi:hypothetical protein